MNEEHFDAFVMHVYENGRLEMFSDDTEVVVSEDGDLEVTVKVDDLVPDAWQNVVR